MKGGYICMYSLKTVQNHRRKRQCVPPAVPADPREAAKDMEEAPMQVRGAVGGGGEAGL